MPDAAKPGLALLDVLGNEALRFDKDVLIGRVPSGTLEGREVTIDLVLQEGKASRVHARLSPTPNSVLVEDLGSTNGTFVNDRRIEKPTAARDRDRIRFDIVEFVLRDLRTSSSSTQKRGGDGGDGTVVRTPGPEPVKPDGAELVGKKGGTVIGQPNRNLPRKWIPAGGTGTIVDQGPREQRVIDVESLEAQTHEPTLWIFSGDSEGYPYILKCSEGVDFWNIGRDPTVNDLSIVLKDPSVSSLHAKLVRRPQNGGEIWKISDQMAANHTYVNGEEYAAKYLSSKDKLRFGRVECVFVLPRSRKGPLAGSSFVAWLKRLWERIRGRR